MAPLEGVIQIEGDITKYETAQQIFEHFEGERADLVVCDGAPDVTGLHDIDEFIQAQLIFRGKDITLLFSQLKLFFAQVTVSKPRSSRNSSIEAFIVCEGYQPPQDYIPNMRNPLLDQKYSNYDELEGSTRCIVPFIACGDLNSYDSDKTYPLVIDDKEYSFREPLINPINPPFATAKLLKTNNKLAQNISSLNDCKLIKSDNLLAEFENDLITKQCSDLTILDPSSSN